MGSTARFMGSTARFMGSWHFAARNAGYVVTKPMKGARACGSPAAYSNTPVAHLTHFRLFC
jgi:hypothetical protein